MYKFLEKEELVHFLMTSELSMREVTELKEEHTEKILVLNKRNTEWYKLEGKVFLNKNVFLGGLFCCSAGVRVSFPNCKTLFVDKCDKNFVYFYIDKRRFPNVEEVYLNASPCDSKIFYEGFKIHLTENYKRYKERWASRDDKVDVITEEQFNQELAKYKEEGAIFG